jgi:preprotein translocase subunit SecA
MEHRWLNKSVETAQRRVEQQHFAVRKRTLEYDDVMNKQRSIVYELRGRVLKGSQEEVHNLILDVMNDVVQTQAERYLFNEKDGSLDDFMNWLGVTFPVTVTEDEIKPLMGTPERAGDLVMKRVEEAYEAKCAGEDPATLPYMERGVFLNVIDREWQDFLRAMDDLRQGVNLRAYGQRDPLVEYKKEAFEMFESLMTAVKSKVISSEFRSATAARMQRMFAALGRRQAAEPRNVEEKQEKPQPKTVADVFASMMSQAAAAPRKPSAAVGRNDPCPCGSGKKYKKCCGRNIA